MTEGRLRILLAIGVIAVGVTALHAPASRDGLFPNAPRTSDWKTYADYRWGQKPDGDGTYDKIPFWRNPTYDPDNGSHVVDYGGDPRADSPFNGQFSSIVADSSVPGGNGKVLAITFPKDFPGGSAPARIFGHPKFEGTGLSWPYNENTGYLYVGLYIKFSRGWTSNGNVSQKLVYANSSSPTNRAINHVPLNLRISEGKPGLFPAYEPQNPFGLYMVPATPSNNVNDARWHLIEMLQEPNTPGRKNGAVRIFIDGRLASSWSDALLFDASHVPSLNKLSLNPIYGGGSHPVPATQVLEFGPLRLMGR
jgi:hypothetical protein